MTQGLGVETHLDVEVVNTLVTIVATVLILFLTPGLQKWLRRRYWSTVSHGKTADFLVSGGFDGFREFLWKVSQSSAEGGDKKRVIWDLLPYVLVIAALQLLPYSTSGVGATASQKDSNSVTVIGSIASPTGEIIITLDLQNLWALQRGDINGEAAPFLLGSPELFNHGTNVTGLDWGLYYSGTAIDSETNSGATDLKIFGDRYTVEQDGKGKGTYPVSTCLTVTEMDGVYSVGTCSDVRIELETIEFVVESVQYVRWTLQSCEEATYAVFNQGVTYRWRNLILEALDHPYTFTEDAIVVGSEVSVVCGEIYESIIEACIFEIGNHVYVGDWNAGAFESCAGEDIESTPREWGMTVVEMDARNGMLPSRDEYEVAVSMLAEVVAGSGTIYSRQQLALVLGVFSRMSGMKLGVGTAYYPETVVVVTISPVVLVLWALLFAAGCAIHIRERRLECEVFIPSTAWDWFAVGARESLGDRNASGSTPPSDCHYLAKYGCQTSLEESDGIVQQCALSWISSGRQEEVVVSRSDDRSIPPPVRRPEMHATSKLVEATRRCVPRPISPPLRRPMQV